MSKDKFDYAFASDLKRARLTCKLVLSQQKIEDSKPKPTLKTDKCLRERNYGIVEDQPISYLYKLQEAAGITGPEFVPENAESLPEMQERAKEFMRILFNEITRANDDSNAK